MMKASFQKGFGLVELMVALVIGLIIVLGAGQLFLTGFTSFRAVERLGMLQSTLLFASDTLVRDIRRADKNSIGEDGTCDNDAKLCLEIADATECDGNKTLHRAYKLSDSATQDEGYSLLQGNACGTDGWSWEPLATGFANDAADGFDVDGSGGVWNVSFCLISVAPSADVDCSAGSDDLIIFRVVNRSSVF